MSRCEGYVANGTIKTPSGEKIEFEDDSHGGETEYWSKTDGSGNLVRKFKQDSAAWWQKYSKGSALMAETMWIDWYGYDRLCGLTDKEYIENYEKSFVSR